MATIAISSDFLEAYSRIPKIQQKKVREFTDKFSIDPTMASINYEPIHDMKDSKVRTVRIGLDYRAIVIHPPNGNVYLLVWVDHHDEAMRWARNKIFEVNRTTGALQIMDTEYIQEKIVSELTEKTSSLFGILSDEQLQQFGVPPIMIPTVRHLMTESQFEQLQSYLPQEVIERLRYVMHGFSFEEIMMELNDTKEDIPIHDDDFEKALKHADSKRRFTIISSTEEMMVLLNEPLAKWRVFLHPDQQELVQRSYKGPVKVLGGAGTGKTVVAMHRAKHLLENSKGHVLLLTYSNNLAKAISAQLRSMLSDDLQERLEVSTIHGWAARFLRSQDVVFDIQSKEHQPKVDEAWRMSVHQGRLEWNLPFYKDEWEDVIQRYGIETLEDYIKIARIGRGTRLNRMQRIQVWQVLQQYKELLDKHNLREWVDIVRDARKLLTAKSFSLPYRSIIVDEIQDLHQEDLKLIRALLPEGPNDLFLVGDAYQRIYKKYVILSQCGIHARGSRVLQLRVNYRTTEQIRQWAVSMLRGEIADDLDGGIDDQRGYRSLLNGERPEIRHFATWEEETYFIRDLLNSAILEGVELHHICLVTRSNRLLEEVYAPILEKDQIPFVYLNPQLPDQGEGVRLATMHRVKGLEFSHVIMASVNEGIVPPITVLESVSDSVSMHDVLKRERSLLYVAATRARDHVVVTSYGRPSSLLLGDSTRSDNVE